MNNKKDRKPSTKKGTEVIKDGNSEHGKRFTDRRRRNHGSTNQPNYYDPLSMLVPITI